MEQITSINDIVELLLKGVTDFSKYGHVSMQSDGDIVLFNYKSAAMFGNWNYFETVSRGLIINRVTGEIVARPLDKFFNWMERGRKASGHIVTVTEKVDGSMGVLYRQNGQYKIATRGSFDSEQAIWATEYLKANYLLDGLNDELTLIFEIIYPDNRVVVDYGDRSDLVLLAVRNRFTGEVLPFYGGYDKQGVYEIAYLYGFNTPQVYNFNDATSIIECCGVIDSNQEGFVVEFSDGSRWKLKGDRYLELHKLISRISYRSVVKSIINDSYDKFIDALPNEFMNEVLEWKKKADQDIATIREQLQKDFEVAPKGKRRDFALYAKDKKYPAMLFAMLDGKDIDVMIADEILSSEEHYNG